MCLDVQCNLLIAKFPIFMAVYENGDMRKKKCGTGRVSVGETRQSRV